MPVSVTFPADGDGTGTASYEVANPVLTGKYVLSQDTLAGVAGANNYLSIFNPAASGKVISLAAVFISSTNVSGVTGAEPLRGFRATAISGGTLLTNATAVTKFQNSYPASIAELRIGNPTATLDGAIFNSPMGLTATTSPTPVHIVTLPAGLGPFTLVAGEGMVLRQSAGDTDNRWHLSIVWAEM